MLSLRSDYQPPYPAYPGVFNLLLQFSFEFLSEKSEDFQTTENLAFLYFICKFFAFYLQSNTE